MEFWRLYRLIRSQIWLIIAMMVVAGAVILAGASLQAQTKEYEAVAVLEPQDVEFQRYLTTPGSQQNNNATAFDQGARISDLIMLLRTSNDLHLRTAALLRRNEEDRAKEVEHILERNGFFAPVDADIASQAARLVSEKELTSGEADTWKRNNQKTARTRIVASLSKSSDEAGPFAAGGVTLSEQAIAERIGEKISADTVSGPLSTEAAPQIVNQIRISARFERAAEADLYVNMLCVAFLDFYTSKSAGAANAQMTLIEKKLDAAKDRLQKARREELAFRRTKGIVLTQAQEAALSQYMLMVADQKKAQQELEMARASTATYQRIYDTMPATTSVALPTTENGLVRAMEQRVAEARFKFAQVKNSNDAENSPVWKAAEQELKSAQSELEKAQKQPFTATSINNNRIQIQGMLATSKAQQQTMQNRLNELNRQVAAQQSIVDAIPAAQAQLSDLRREATTAENSVQQLQESLEVLQIRAIKEGKAGTISIVSQAHSRLLTAGIGTQRGKILAYGMILALLFGVAMVIGMDALDNSIRTTQDVEKLLELPVVGIIPQQLQDPSQAPLLALQEPMSPIAESYRLLRTDLLFTAAEKPFRSLMMATGKPGQGSTTTISNLAITLAQSGKRVILVDADLRYPKLHNVFRVPNQMGLTTLLTDRATIDDVLQPTMQENLWLLPGGPVVVNPSELLGSERMKQLHEQLKERVDYVLFDTPSAIAFSDAAILSSFLDATVMVIRANNIPRGSEDMVRRFLEKAKANILGVVLNGVPADRVDSVHYHYSYYPALLPGSTATDPSNPYYSSESVRALGPGSRSADADMPLALPGMSTSGTAGEGAVQTAQRSLTATTPIPQNGNGTHTAYANGNGINGHAVNGTGMPAHAMSVDVKRKRNWLKNIPWKLVLTVVIVGAVVGFLVLTLAGSTKVK